MSEENPVQPETTEPTTVGVEEMKAAAAAAQTDPPETPPAPAETDTTDYKQQLAVKDAEIANLRGQLKEAEGNQELQQHIAVRLGEVVNERQELADKLDAAIASRTAAVTTLAQATLSTLDQKAELEQRIAAIEEELRKKDAAREAAEAKATKLELLTREFPQLLPYQDRIINSTDPEVVRADAKAFAQTRSADLQSLQRIAQGTALMGAPQGGQPVSPPVAPEAPASFEDGMAELRAAMTNEHEFNKAIQARIRAYEASKGAS